MITFQGQVYLATDVPDLVAAAMAHQFCLLQSCYVASVLLMCQRRQGAGKLPQCAS